MNTNDTRSQPSRRPRARRLLPWTVVLLLGLIFLAAMPGAWALPNQAPDYQTVPTLTPLPTRPGQATDTPGPQPTDTPAPSQPTDTPAPNQPTDTPAPSQPTDTPVPGQPTNTPTSSPTASPTRLAVTVTPVLPATCWTVPTPGFSPLSAPDIEFVVQSDQLLVVPGQQVTLRYIVTNQGDVDLADLLVCAPLEAILGRGQVSASDGAARLVADGLIFELADLAAGDSVTAEVQLTIPASAPLGSVIENQAWLFADGIQASTDLLTWALPPAFLPPTGHDRLSCGQR